MGELRMEKLYVKIGFAELLVVDVADFIEIETVGQYDIVDYFAIPLCVQDLLRRMAISKVRQTHIGTVPESARIQTLVHIEDDGYWVDVVWITTE